MRAQEKNRRGRRRNRQNNGNRIRRQTIISRVLERKIERKSFKSVTAELQRM